VTRPGEFNQCIISYVTDAGVTMTASEKLTMAQAVGNPIVALRTNQGIPERWHYRYIRIVTIYGGRTYWRKVIISSAQNPIFVGTKKTLLIDGIVWQVWERKGESRRGPYQT